LKMAQNPGKKCTKSAKEKPAVTFQIWSSFFGRANTGTKEGDPRKV